MEVSGQLHAPAAFPRGKSSPPPYPLDSRLGGPQSRSGLCEEQKNLCMILVVFNVYLAGVVSDVCNALEVTERLWI
jgi:hypothetical protein